jgi:hypothetical protein
VIISVWAVFGSLAGAALGCVVGGVIYSCCVSPFAGLVVVGGGLVCAGLSIFAFFGSRAATKGTLRLTKKLLLGMKKLFIKKEEAR